MNRNMAKQILVTVLGFITMASMTMPLVGCSKAKPSEKDSENTIQEEQTDTIPESYEVTPPDADSYYQTNSTVISEVDAADSDDVLTEAETCDTLTDRGFTQFPITSSYSMDGEYYDSEDILDNAATKHPMYETYYAAANGNIWTIFMINGVTMANPVSYNLQSGLGVQVIISESETVISYDSTTNKFFETVPDPSALIVVTIDRIDAKSLEALTIEEIDGYVN